MPNFKPKTCKNIVIDKKKTITLYGKHKEFLNEFDKNELILPKIKKELTKLKDNLNEENII